MASDATIQNQQSTDAATETPAQKQQWLKTNFENFEAARAASLSKSTADGYVPPAAVGTADIQASANHDADKIVNDLDNSRFFGASNDWHTSISGFDDSDPSAHDRSVFNHSLKHSISSDMQNALSGSSSSATDAGAVAQAGSAGNTVPTGEATVAQAGSAGSTTSDAGSSAASATAASAGSEATAAQATASGANAAAPDFVVTSQVIHEAANQDAQQIVSDLQSGGMQTASQDYNNDLTSFNSVDPSAYDRQQYSAQLGNQISQQLEAAFESSSSTGSGSGSGSGAGSDGSGGTTGTGSNAGGGDGSSGGSSSGSGSNAGGDGSSGGTGSGSSTGGDGSSGGTGSGSSTGGDGSSGGTGSGSSTGGDGSSGGTGKGSNAGGGDGSSGGSSSSGGTGSDGGSGGSGGSTANGDAIGLGNSSENPDYFQNVKGLHQNPADTGVAPKQLSSLIGTDYHVGLSVAEGNGKGYNYPIQTADGTNGWSDVKVTIPGWSYPKGTTSLKIPIPQGGFAPATGTDGHLRVEDPTNGQYYDVWQLKKGADGSYTASSVATGSLYGDGVGGSNATNIAGGVGDVTQQELDSGVINHYLALGAEQSWINKIIGDQGAATNTDGTIAGAPLSENGKIALKLPPGKTLADYDLTTAGKAIYGALLNYGGLIVGKGPNGDAFNAYTTGVSSTPDFGPDAALLNKYLVYYQ